MRVLQIDAWTDNDGGYEWNNWFIVGTIDKEEFEKLDTEKKQLAWFRRNGYTTTGNKRKCYIDNDHYNLTVCDRKTGCPAFAIEYGPEY